MEQIPEDPVSVQKFRKEPGPWDPIRLSGDTGKTPRSPPLPDADNQTSRLPHTLQYKIRSPDGTSSIRSAVQLDQSPSSESGYGTSTLHSTGHHETQNPTSTVPTTTEASLRNEICQPSKTQDKELSSAESDESDGREASVEGHEPVGGVRLLKRFKRLALRRNRSLEPDTRSRDPVRPTVRYYLGNLLHRVYKRVASLADSARRDAVPSRAEPFNRNIEIADVNCDYIPARALRDTQCHAGNWISRRLVELLGRQDEISHDYEPPNLTDAGGHKVVACGIISLQWKWSRRETRIHECKFFVLQSPNLDVHFGVDYNLSEELLTINERAMQVKWSPKIFERHSVRRNRSLESDTLSRDPLQLINRILTPSTAGQKFMFDIKVADVHDNYKLAVAILDTGCHAGNWISRNLVERLGWQDKNKVSQDYKPPDLTDAGGHKVVACGSITLQWKWSPQGSEVIEDDFFIFQESPHVDVVLGAEFLVSRNLVTVNKQLMIPMIAHNKASTSEKAAIALALEERKREKTALDTRRMQTQQVAGQQQGGPSSQAQQSGQQAPTQQNGQQSPTQTQGRQRP